MRAWFGSLIDGWQRPIRGDVPNRTGGNRTPRASQAREEAAIDHL
jgi:hypothetical protein